MSIEHYSRRRFNSLIASAPLWPLAAKAFAATTREFLITKSGAVADDSTINTKAIQAAIDQLAAKGGGTVVVPNVLPHLEMLPKVWKHFLSNFDRGDEVNV
jgi:polygalacturonase